MKILWLVLWAVFAIVWICSVFHFAMTSSPGWLLLSIVFLLHAMMRFFQTLNTD